MKWHLLAGCLVLALPLGSPAETDGKPQVMQKFTVNEKHLLCFGVAITLWEDKNSGLVLEMYVRDVAPGSMAESKGLRPGTRIWAIDGISAESFEATFAAGSGLAEKFLNRKPGDQIVLELAPAPGERHSRLIVLKQGALAQGLTLHDEAAPPPDDWNWKRK